MLTEEFRSRTMLTRSMLQAVKKCWAAYRFRQRLLQALQRRKEARLTIQRVGRGYVSRKINPMPKPKVLLLILIIIAHYYYYLLLLLLS